MRKVVRIVVMLVVIGIAYYLGNIVSDTLAKDM